jgi:hypothetical protein
MIARSPSASFFSPVDDRTCITRCFASFVVFPAEFAHHLEGRRHDGAAIGGTTLHHLARPFRIEQVGKTLRRVFRFTVGCRQSTTGRCASTQHAVGIAILFENVCDLPARRRQPAVLFQGWCEASEVLMTSAAMLLANCRCAGTAARTGALDLHDAGIGGFKPAELFTDRRSIEE